MRVLIAGAGLCGLTTALALLRRGYDVRVFEQASELREVGAGVQLGSNGTRVLIALGLEAAMWTTASPLPPCGRGRVRVQRDARITLSREAGEGF
jgi:2-polyprenyl-6-methoxyphenol hydroxylase-like FAD-dependent oxidoreductase